MNGCFGCRVGTLGYSGLMLCCAARIRRTIARWTDTGSFECTECTECTPNGGLECRTSAACYLTSQSCAQYFIIIKQYFVLMLVPPPTCLGEGEGVPKANEGRTLPSGCIPASEDHPRSLVWTAVRVSHHCLLKRAATLTSVFFCSGKRVWRVRPATVRLDRIEDVVTLEKRWCGRKGCERGCQAWKIRRRNSLFMQKLLGLLLASRRAINRVLFADEIPALPCSGCVRGQRCGL